MEEERYCHIQEGDVKKNWHVLQGDRPTGAGERAPDAFQFVMTSAQALEVEAEELLQVPYVGLDHTVATGPLALFLPYTLGFPLFLDPFVGRHIIRKPCSRRKNPYPLVSLSPSSCGARIST